MRDGGLKCDCEVLRDLYLTYYVSSSSGMCHALVSSSSPFLTTPTCLCESFTLPSLTLSEILTFLLLLALSRSLLPVLILSEAEVVGGPLKLRPLGVVSLPLNRGAFCTPPVELLSKTPVFVGVAGCT